MNWLKLKLWGLFTGNALPKADSMWHQPSYFVNAVVGFKYKITNIYVGETHVQLIPVKYGLNPKHQKLLIDYLKFRGYNVGSPVVNDKGQEEYLVEIPDYFRRKAGMIHPDKRGTAPPASRNSGDYVSLKNVEISPPLLGEHTIHTLSPAPTLVTKMLQRELPTGTCTVTIDGNEYRLVPLASGVAEPASTLTEGKGQSNIKECIDVGVQPPAPLTPTKPRKGYHMANKLSVPVL